MKIYKLSRLADANPTNEYLLGPNIDTGSVFLLYGRLRPGETGRRIITAEGAEEIICIIKGAIKIESGNYAFTVTAGEAFVSRKPQTFILDNAGPEEAIYISAGSRTFSEKKAEPPQKPAEPANAQAASQAAGESAESSAGDEADYIITKDETREEETPGKG